MPAEFPSEGAASDARQTDRGGDGMNERKALTRRWRKSREVWLSRTSSRAKEWKLGNESSTR